MVPLYTPAWLACPVAADAPALDLALQQDVIHYKTVDIEVAEAALRVATRPVWYLWPQIVPLALCSRRVYGKEDNMVPRC